VVDPNGNRTTVRSVRVIFAEPGGAPNGRQRRDRLKKLNAVGAKGISPKSRLIQGKAHGLRKPIGQKSANRLGGRRGSQEEARS